MDNDLHFVEHEEENIDWVYVEPVPYVDEYGVERPGLVYYKADNGCKMLQLESGELYDDAIDRADSGRHYVQTEEPIEEPEEEQSGQEGGDDL